MSDGPVASARVDLQGDLVWGKGRLGLGEVYGVLQILRRIIEQGEELVGGDGHTPWAVDAQGEWCALDAIFDEG